MMTTTKNLNTAILTENVLTDEQQLIIQLVDDFLI